MNARIAFAAATRYRHHNFDNLVKLMTMNTPLLKHIDNLIDQFKKDHRGEPPLYIVLSPDETKDVVDALKEKQKAPEDTIITTYRDIKIAESPALLRGNSYVSNDLPDTGS